MLMWIKYSHHSATDHVGGYVVGPGGDRTPVMDDLPRAAGPALIPRMTPNETLTRGSDPHRSDCWLIDFSDIHVGSVGRAVGTPGATERWVWFCGFYPGSNHMALSDRGRAIPAPCFEVADQTDTNASPDCYDDGHLSRIMRGGQLPRVFVARREPLQTLRFDRRRQPPLVN